MNKTADFIFRSESGERRDAADGRQVVWRRPKSSVFTAPGVEQFEKLAVLGPLGVVKKDQA